MGLEKINFIQKHEQKGFYLPLSANYNSMLHAPTTHKGNKLSIMDSINCFLQLHCYKPTYKYYGKLLCVNRDF